MTEKEWEMARINLSGLAMQGMLERDSSTLSKVVSDTFYKHLAHHCVAIADEIIKELKKGKPTKD